MKVLFLGHGALNRHATIKRAFGMAPWLVSKGIEISIICEEDPANRAAVTCPEVKLLTYPKGTLFQERAAKRRLLRGSYDIVHICGLGWRNLFLSTSRRRGFYIMDHTEMESVLPGRPFWRRHPQAFLERFSKMRYNGSVAASRYLYRHLTEGNDRPVQYLPYGSDPFSPDASAKSASIRREYGLGRYALYAGGFYLNYGIWTILKVAETLARQRSDFQLVLLGRGPEENAIRDWISTHNLAKQIILPGYIPQERLELLVCAAHALLAPLHDTIADRARCPSKIPLYMMSQRPIVTCKIGEAWEYLGEAGYYYDPHSPASLGEVLLSLWARGPIHRHYNSERLTWQSIAERYINYWRPYVTQRPFSV